MPIQLTERSFVGERAFRPRPEVHVDQSSGLIIVATPWGDRGVARKTIDRMGDYLALSRQDLEATTPFAHLTCLPAQANNLRVAALLANEAVLRDENRQEYKSGVELFAGILGEDEFSWIQVGNPQILLSRKARMPVPLGSQIDLANDLSVGEKLLPPLPSQLLGVDASVNFIINSFRASPGDRLILISHSQIPDSIYSSPHGEDFEHLGRRLAMSQSGSAFWLGVLEINESYNQREAA